MKKLNINHSDYSKITTPDSLANNLSFDINLLMGDTKSIMTRWSVWTNPKHNNLYIEFSGKSRTDIDMLELHLKSLQFDYNFDFGFVNPSTLILNPNFSSSDFIGVLFIENISHISKVA